MCEAELTISLLARAEVSAVGPSWYCKADEEIEPPPSVVAYVRLALVIGALSVTLTFRHTLLTPVI